MYQPRPSSSTSKPLVQSTALLTSLPPVQYREMAANGTDAAQPTVDEVLLDGVYDNLETIG